MSRVIRDVPTRPSLERRKRRGPWIDFFSTQEGERILSVKKDARQWGRDPHAAAPLTCL